MFACWDAEEVVQVVNIEVEAGLVIAEDCVNQINTQDGDLHTEQENWAPFCHRDHALSQPGPLQRKQTEEGWRPEVKKDVFNLTLLNKGTDSATRINYVSNKLNDSDTTKYRLVMGISREMMQILPYDNFNRDQSKQFDIMTNSNEQIFAIQGLAKCQY